MNTQQKKVKKVCRMWNQFIIKVHKSRHYIHIYLLYKWRKRIKMNLYSLSLGCTHIHTHSHIPKKIEMFWWWKAFILIIFNENKMRKKIIKLFDKETTKKKIKQKLMRMEVLNLISWYVRRLAEAVRHRKFMFNVNT